MKRTKRIIAIMLSVVMMFSVGIVENKTVTKVKADSVFAITSPTAGSLKAAGHIDIKWTSASSYGTVKNYRVYVDGSLEKTTTSLTYEYYTTKVNYHTAWIVADFNDGTSRSTESVRFSVTKKGLCVNSSMGRNLYPYAMNVSWYYDWGTEPLSQSAYSDLEYVPMIWGTSNEGSISSIAKKNYKYLLAYNEPDMTSNVGGSNINVNTAISHWSKFLGNSYYLGAPAPALSPSWDSGTWFRTFMSGIDTSTVDFIPLHCYYEQYGGAAGAKTFLEEVVDKTWEMYHKPIWITEFAVSGWGYSNTSARQSVEEFLKTAIDGLNERDYVVRYSWFSFDTTDTSNGASALWTNLTGKLTDLGNTYVNYGNPTTDYKAGNAVNNMQNGTAKETVTKPAKTSVKTAKNVKGRKIKISLKKIAKATGYQIRWSDSKKYNGYWQKTIKKTTYTLTKLDKKTTYYIKARAYAKSGNKKLYSGWSSSRSVKVKK
jgi:hypothetical protein